ncbi:MAG: arginine N-succinyltransferase [Phycisphaerae bacterium]|nr:arginine N-succinyltransferase [Tepidisphaeraceae bacterium]
MYVIRPIALDDLPHLLALSAQTGFGLTTLPNDEKLLRRRIRQSVHAFEKLGDDDPPLGDAYLFVLERTDTREVCGTCGITSKVGGFEPFYAYRVETAVHASAILNVRREIRTLHLVETHDGPCEIGSLFLAPAHRGGGNGRLLSLGRFLFMADYPSYFEPVVIAEMRGVVDPADGHSPFWEAVGRHFFEVDYPQADYMSMVNKRFIAELMPRHPIYIPLLPADAQAVIGEVHPDTRPALRILQDEGFAYSGMVDIFEAGPVVRARLSEIRAARDSRSATVTAITDTPAVGEPHIVTSRSGGFRAAVGHVTPTDPNGVAIEARLATALAVSAGATVRYVSLKPASRPSAPYPDANIAFD